MTRYYAAPDGTITRDDTLPGDPESDAIARLRAALTTILNEGQAALDDPSIPLFGVVQNMVETAQAALGLTGEGDGEDPTRTAH